jgi:hypothetical protein
MLHQELRQRRRNDFQIQRPRHVAVGEIVPAIDKFRELLQKLIAPDTRNAMAISVALNAPIDRPHYGVFRM